MAILSKIRDKSLFLILIIGLALFAFVASPKSIMNFFSSNKANSIGTVDGEHITREEFNEEIKAYKNNRGEINDAQATKAVWENLVASKIFDSQLNKAGIVIGERDVWNALISDPSINSNPQFQNEAGLFDEESLKTFIAEMKEDDTDEGKQKWQSWLQYENDLSKNEKRKTYLSAIAAGLNVTLEEAQLQYNRENTVVSGKYVFLPFSKIADSTIQVSEKEMTQYIDAHKKQFKTRATRNIQYVSFQVAPSAEDKKDIADKLVSLLDDKEEFDTETQGVKIVKGFRNTENNSEFVSEHSDLPENKNFIFKTEQPKDSLFDLEVGTVFGPYEENGYYKVSKIAEKKDVPEHKASHILISFKETGNPEAQLTKEEAKAKIDELEAKIKAGADFGEEAQLNSADKGSATKKGDLGWFKEGMMVPQFNDWVFSHKTGDMGIVETQFGYHLIKIYDTRSELGLRLASVGLKIEPSEKTLNAAFIEAESFVSAALKNPKDFQKLADERKLVVQKSERMQRGVENVAGLPGNNSQIVYWTFENGIEKGDIKRFDTDQNYIVAQVTDIQKEGIMTLKTAESKVKPILIKQKKADLLEEKLKKGSLVEIGKAENESVLNVYESTLLSATGPLANDKSVIAVLAAMKEGTIMRNIVGKSGVYAAQLDTKMVPAALSSYEAIRTQMESAMRKDDNSIFKALKDASDVGELKL